MYLQDTIERKSSIRKVIDQQKIYERLATGRKNFDTTTTYKKRYLVPRSRAFKSLYGYNWIVLNPGHTLYFAEGEFLFASCLRFAITAKQLNFFLLTGIVAVRRCRTT